MEKSENSLNQLEVGSGICPPSGRCVASQVSFYFTFLLAQRTDNPPNDMKCYCQDWQVVTSFVILKY